MEYWSPRGPAQAALQTKANVRLCTHWWTKERGRCCVSEDTEGCHHQGMQLTIGGLTDHSTNTKKYTTDSHPLRQDSGHFLTPNVQMQTGRTQTHSWYRKPADPFRRGVKKMSGTHCKRRVRQSCQNNRLLHHSTSEPGCSGRWSSETHSGNM